MAAIQIAHWPKSLQKKTLSFWVRKEMEAEERDSSLVFPIVIKGFLSPRFVFIKHEHLLWMYSFPGAGFITSHLIELVLLRGPWSVLQSWDRRVPRLHPQLLSLDPQVTLQPEELWKQAICQKNCVSCLRCCFFLLLVRSYTLRVLDDYSSIIMDISHILHSEMKFPFC